MFNIYYQPHRNRLLESAFFQHLMRSFPEAQVINSKFDIDPKYLDCFVQKDELIARLNADNLLPSKRRQDSLALLANCPDRIKIALNINRISFDIVIEKDEQIYFWEFHESQHRKLTVNRSSSIYNGVNNAVIRVPRYLQRLIRDVWRVKCFPSSTIIWYDWFAQNRDIYKPELKNNFYEKFLPSKFSFENFLLIS